MIAIALYSVVCSQCSTCGLPQQEDSLPELNVRIHTVSYRIMDHSALIECCSADRLFTADMCVCCGGNGIMRNYAQRLRAAVWLGS